jgi:hypothetical protein
MATAWRPAHDPLSQYLASVDHNNASSNAPDDDDEGAAAAAEAAADEEEAQTAAAVAAEPESDAPEPPEHARWWGRLVRHGILPPSVASTPPLLPAMDDERLARAVLRYQITLRAAIRQLQGTLALLCGRGVAVPMPPLAALRVVDASMVAAAEAHCPALPALRAALVG